MPWLILLNGPPGIGKSTVAALFADRYPGTLNLDIDRVRMMLGGWREDFVRSGETVRPIAHAMTHAHLMSNGSVIVPQYLADSREVADFEQIAIEHGAEFAEVLLFESRNASVDRLLTWDVLPDQSEADFRHVIARVVLDRGGRRYAESMYDQLMEGIANRRQPLQVRCVEGDVHGTLALLIEATIGRSLSDPPD